MAEEKMQAAKVLLKNPYRQVILQDYNKTLESHKFRKKAEEIENELSWFTGKSSQYRVEDRQGFFKHFQEHYAGKKHAPLAPMYRPLSSYKFGEEPQIVYFMMLFVKKDEEYKNQIKWIIPNAQKNCMEPIHLILEKGGETCPDNPHEGEEFGYVLKGKVEIHLGKKSYIAKKGDAFYYKADKTHYLKGIEQTELIWVTSPPSF